MLPLLSLAALPVVSAYLAAKDSTTCRCFRTTSNTSTHVFSNHLVQDFRDLARYTITDEGFADPDTGVPHLLDVPELAADARRTSSYFDNEWANVWGLQSWNNSYPNTTNGGDATLLMVNSKNNIYIERDPDASLDDDGYETFLSLRTARHDDFQSSAEFESTDANFLHLSMRMLARTVGDDGACTAMFTYLPGSDDVQEADVEFLTSGPRNAAQYTNQPGSHGSTANATMPLGGQAMGEWAVHRLDWTKGRSEWFVNDELVATIEENAPVDPAMVIFNAWSDGGSWTGVMPVNGTAALQMQWIEIAYNTSATTDDEDCSVMCDIDGDQVGVIDDGGSGSGSGNDSGGSWSVSVSTGAVLGHALLLGVWGLL